MISLKDIGIIAGIITGTVVPGSIYVNSIDTKVVRLAETVYADQRIRNQREMWLYEDRLKANPQDNVAAVRLRELKYEQEVLDYKQQQLKGGK
jgi:hypothetical protein